MAGTYSPQSGVRGVHINRDLSNFSVMYRGRGFVADQLFPVIPVNNESDDYYQWDKGQAFQEDRTDGMDTLVADGAYADEESYGATIRSYRTRAYKRKTRITDRERKNADSSLNLEKNKVALLKDKMLRGYELRVAGIARNTANYNGNAALTLAGVNQWNSASFVSQTSQGQSVIVQEFLAAMDQVRKNTGSLLPNVALIPFSVLTVMRNDKGLVDSTKFTQNYLPDGKPFGESFLGMRIITPMAMSSNHIEGEAPNLVDIWGTDVILAYVEPNPTTETLTFGTTFRSRDWLVRQGRDEEGEFTWYEQSVIQDERLVAADCAYIIKSAIA